MQNMPLDMWIRTIVTGVILAVFTTMFLWFRGDMGAVAVSGGNFTPPTAASTAASLDATLPEQRAAAYGEPHALVSEGALAPSKAFYVGHLIAKPWRAPVGASENAQSAAGAIAAAGRLGAVRSALVGAFFIDLNDTYRAGVDPEALDAIAEDTGANCEGRPDVDRLQQSAEYAVSCAMSALRSSGQFEFVERDYIVSLAQQRSGPPVNDPLYSLQWPLHPQGTRDDASPGGAGFAEFWTRASQPGSRTVQVAVIDNGIDFSHPQIAESDNILPGVDAISKAARAGDGDRRDLDPTDFGEVCYDSFDDPTYHGTQIAGLIGAATSNDGIGVAGAAWRVGIVPIRAFGACGALMSDVAEAIVWASGAQWMVVEASDAGGAGVRWNSEPARIINVSASFPAPEGCPRTLQEAINIATTEGSIVVAPAGNDGADASGYAPGNCNNVITVAASDALGALTAYSNAGPSVDILAPGGDLLADQDFDGRPDGILTVARAQACTDLVEGLPVDGCEHMMMSGTSYAAAYVSAALALLSAEYPDFGREELTSLLLDVARTPRSDEQCPRECGSGLLNLGRAIRTAGATL